MKIKRYFYCKVPLTSWKDNVNTNEWIWNQTCIFNYHLREETAAKGGTGCILSVCGKRRKHTAQTMDLLLFVVRRHICCYWKYITWRQINVPVSREWMFCDGCSVHQTQIQAFRRWKHLESRVDDKESSCVMDWFKRSFNKCSQNRWTWTLGEQHDDYTRKSEGSRWLCLREQINPLVERKIACLAVWQLSGLPAACMQDSMTDTVPYFAATHNFTMRLVSINAEVGKLVSWWVRR